MRRFWVGLAMAISLAAITAGGVVITQDGGEPPEGTANLWVEDGAGSCARSSTPVDYAGSASPDARCGDFDLAYDAANASADASTVLIVADTYPDFLITGHRSSTSRITFDEASGDVLISDWIGFGTGEEGSQPTQGPDYVTIKNISTTTQGVGAVDPDSRWGLFMNAGTSFIRLENITHGGFVLRGVKDIEFIGGEAGPCRRGQTYEGCEINKADPTPSIFSEGGTGSTGCSWATTIPTESSPAYDRVCGSQNITIDGVYFHDYTILPSCVSACHWRGMYMTAVHGLTIRNSVFSNNVFEPWSTVFGHGSYLGNKDHLIENNYFGLVQDTPSGNGGGWSSAWCQNAGTGVNGYENVTVRFNSFAFGSTLGVPGGNNPEGEVDCDIVNYKVYGNLFGVRHGTANCGLAVVEWSYNIYAGAVSGTCDSGTGEVNIGGSSMPMYVNDTDTPVEGDFVLTGSNGSYDNLVPTGTPGCPSTDHDGVSRPQNTNCDAGAHERNQ